MASSSNKTTRTIQKLLATAQRHAEKGHLDKAVAAYRELARLEPNNIRHWVTIGYLESKLGNLEVAAAIFRKLGNFYDSHGETAKAIAVFRQVISLCPRDTPVHLKLAELQLKENRSVESWKHYRAALALLLEKDRRIDAVKVLVAMTVLQPDNVALWVRLGETAVVAGMLERGVSALTQAMDLLRQRGHTEQYVRVAERVLSLTPGDLRLACELGALYLERGDVPSALVKLHRCYDTDPRDVQTLTLLVDAFLRLEDRDKAINALQLLADLHLDRGEKDLYAQTCQQLFALDPSLAPIPEPARPEPSLVVDIVVEPLAESADPGADSVDAEAERADKVEALLKEAAGYTKIGLFDGAADVLRQARALDPNHERVFELLKSVYRKLDTEDEVVALLVDHAERLVERAPDRAAALLEEAQNLNADHPAVFRARIGPLDPLAADSGPDEDGSGLHMVAEQRWAGERSGRRLMSDITEVTVKRRPPPDVTARINVDDLEQTLLAAQSSSRQEKAQQGADDHTDDIRAMGAQPSSPHVLLSVTTDEIDLDGLRQALEMDTAAEDGSTPARADERRDPEPDNA